MKKGVNAWMNNLEQKYLKNMAKLYPTVAAACTEIINLQSILNLPKGTEHFMTDIHGEYEQFFHVLKNGSGSVRKKIEEEFGNTLSSRDKKSLATLIYYPELKVDLVEKDRGQLRGLVPDYPAQINPDLQEGSLQIYPLKSAQSTAKRFCLCDRGADYGERRTAGQRSLLQFHHQHHYPYRKRKRIYHCHEQSDPAAGSGSHSHCRGYF